MYLKKMRGAAAIVLLSAAIAVTAKDGAANGVAYFAALPFRESPFPNLRGIHPLTVEQARTRNHYRFEYDARGRVVRVSFRLGDRARDPNHTANHFFLSASVAIEYEEGREVRRFFDRFGAPTTVRGDVFREVFLLDEAGWRRELLFENERGERIENAWGVARYRWTIEPDGAVIEERFDMAGKPAALRPNFPFYRLRLRYGPEGWLALMQNIDENGGLVENDTGAAQDKLEFNAAGDILAWNVLNAKHEPTRGNGPDVARGVIAPGPFGAETGIRFEDAAGRPIPNAYGFWGSRTEYDERGNMVARAFLDAEGKPAPHGEAGYVHLRMSWDKTGMNRLGLAYFDADGKPVAHAQRGFASARQAYDRSGNLIRMTFHDVNGDLVGRMDTGVAIIERRYDEAGRLVATRHLDPEGRAVETP